jgi:uncharacterized membrane protein
LIGFSWASSAARSDTSWWRAGPSPRVLLWVAIGAYAAGFAALSVLRDRALNTGRFDLGNMVQAVWATAHGHPLRVTDLNGDQISRLAAHTDAILVLFAPLWRVWPSADMLLTVQAAAVALGALPVYRLAQRHLGSPKAALGFALVYLLYPPVQWLTLNEFHPVALATPLLLFAFDALDRDRLRLFAVYAALAVLTKEEIGLVVAGMGIWYALSRRRVRTGVAIAAAGALVSAVAIGVVIPHYNDGASSSFYSRYGDVGGSPGGILKTAVTHPLRLVTTAFDHRGVHYLVDLVVPLLVLGAAAPLALVVAVPELALNLLSTTPTQTSIHYHYTAGIIPALIVAAVLGAARLLRGRLWLAAPLAGAAVAAMLVTNYALGAVPLWRYVPGGETYQATASRVTAHDRVAARALRLIPPGVVVSASNNLGAHLSARRRVLSLPFVQDATWVAADETQPGYADRMAPVPAEEQLVWLRRNPAWKLVFQEDGIVVFRRVLPP